MTSVKVGIGAFALVSTLAGGGWGAHEYVTNNLASKEAVEVVENKADYVLDQQMAALIAQIAYLEQKKNKTADEINQLNYLRKQLDSMRKVRSAR